jgi:hypothetical protein
MLLKRDKDVQKAIELEGKIEVAIADLKNRKIPNILRAAIVYEVLYSTLYDRLYSKPTKAVSSTNKRKLTQSEEDILI